MPDAPPPLTEPTSPARQPVPATPVLPYAGPKAGRPTPVVEVVFTGLIWVAIIMLAAVVVMGVLSVATVMPMREGVLIAAVGGVVMLVVLVRRWAGWK